MGPLLEFFDEYRQGVYYLEGDHFLEGIEIEEFFFQFRLVASMALFAGNSMTIMIACINPADTYVDETLCTLFYAGLPCLCHRNLT